MKLQYRNFLVIVMVLGFAVSGEAQNNVSAVKLEDILSKAEKATREYSETFKNLSAEETKIFEDYDKENVLQRVSKIKSTFIVYQSPKNGEVNEFRNVLEFNGRNVALPDNEVGSLFEKLSAEDSVAEEWKRIIAEGVRFDGKSSAWGMTLWQETPLEELRPFFDFSISAGERINNREIIVVEYRQIKPTLLIKFNPSAGDWKKEPHGREYYADISSAFRSADARLIGKLWLDAETGQLWKNESRVVIYPARLSNPQVALSVAFEYQPSDFKILVPKSFVYTFYKISGSNDKNLSVSKDRIMRFDYSKFSKFKAETGNFQLSGKN
ncbi:MAG: hypothetical protein ACR2L1_03820 [Pyrinomonadaceae bacterium]